MDENRITYFGETDARNKRVKFGIKAKDRTRHVYVIGKTGMGKSTMLENMAVQDIMGHEGMCFIDPHGKTADLLLEYVPKERIRDVIYIAPFDTDYPISFNVLESVDPQKRHLVASGLMSTFKKIWEDAWSARMEYILTNTLLALLEAPGSTLLGVNRMLSDKEYRKEIVSHVQDPSVKTFWNKEFASYTERQAAEAVPAIQNKVGQFTANPLIRNMIGQEHSSFDFREAMDKKKIIIINLSKGRIGDENMKLLGGLLVTKIYLAAMSRADVPDRTAKMLPNFYLFVDEFQNFANASFADILSEARKYKLNLTIAHQYIEQMDEIVRPAVFGNVGTMIAFRVGATDAEALEKEFAPIFVLEDLVNLGFAQIYLKLMIDGLSSQPFSATTLPPIAHPEVSYVKEIISASREQFARPRAEVEQIVMAFHNPVAKPPVTKTVPTVKTSIPSTIPSPVNKESATIKVVPNSNPVNKEVVPIKAVENIPKPPTINTVVNSNVSKSPVVNSAVNSNVSQSVVSASNPEPAVTSSKSITNSSAPKSVSAPIQQVSKPPQSKPSPSMPSINSHHPLEDHTKPVSLHTLAARHAPRNDPKVPTPKNVNSLKDALSAALGKTNIEKKDSVVPQQKPVNVGIVKPVPPTNISPASIPAKEVPKEVPEDLLKKVLKDD
ncbi:MAG: type IV secretion system DNA-binding domain-containing protein [Candidatus Paceibacterota bacterium]|jgi:hypothetical protein